jgi:steroid delta-isomerase-like uncharacterized protein
MARPLPRAHPRTMTTNETNTTVVTEFIQDLFSKGDLTAVDRYLADDFVNHDPPFGSTTDREGMRAAGAMFRSAFPDWHSELEQFVCEGDLVVERFTARGTHRGEVMGVAATGREVALPGINIWRLRDGKITDRWGRLDELGFLQQLGVVPGPTA